MSTTINGRRTSLRYQARIKAASGADAASQCTSSILAPSVSVSNQPASRLSHRKKTTKTKKAVATKKKNMKAKEKVAMDVSDLKDMEAKTVHAKIVPKKNHVAVLYPAPEKKLPSSPSPPCFDLMMTMRFKNIETSCNNQQCSDTVRKSVEMPSNFDDDNNENDSSNENLSSKFGKRNSSIGVDSNLSSEFSETQEPSVAYKFEY